MPNQVSKVNDLKHFFLHLIESGKLSHAYLFLGEDPREIHNLIAAISSRILREKTGDDVFENANLIEVKIPEGKKTLSVDQMRTVRDIFAEKSEHPQIAVIDDADKMTDSAANSILKFIEEPYDRQYIFLQARNRNRVLPTILSRVQLINIPKQKKSEISEQLVDKGIQEDEAIFISWISKSISQADDLLLDGFAINLKRSITEWLDEIFNRKEKSFAFVQSDLLNFVDTNEHQNIFNLALSSELSMRLEKAPNSVLADILDRWLVIYQRSRFTVSWQTMLESFTLEALRMVNGTEKFSNK
ncbi:DNA polymerase III subunit delta' [Oenococcus oeni]